MTGTISTDITNYLPGFMKDEPGVQAFFNGIDPVTGIQATYGMNPMTGLPYQAGLGGFMQQLASAVNLFRYYNDFQNCPINQLNDFVAQYGIVFPPAMSEESRRKFARDVIQFNRANGSIRTLDYIFSIIGIAVEIQYAFMLDTAIIAAQNQTANFDYIFSNPSLTGTTYLDYITVTDGGSGYTGTPTAAFSGGGGTGAAATVNVVSNVVTSLTVTNWGSGYTSAPTIVISGGGGINATATATMSFPQRPDGTATFADGVYFFGTSQTTSTYYPKIPIKFERYVPGAYVNPSGYIVAKLPYVYMNITSHNYNTLTANWTDPTTGIVYPFSSTDKFTLIEQITNYFLDIVRPSNVVFLSLATPFSLSDTITSTVLDENVEIVYINAGLKYDGSAAYGTYIDRTVFGINFGGFEYGESVMTQAGQVFGTGNGTTTTFNSGDNFNPTVIPLNSVWKSDWQGNQLQYSTPRTNRVIQSNNIVSGGFFTPLFSSTVATTASTPDASVVCALYTASANGYGGILRGSISLPLGANAGSFIFKPGTARYIGIRICGAAHLGDYYNYVDTSTLTVFNAYAPLFPVTVLQLPDGWIEIKQSGSVPSGDSGIYDFAIVDSTGNTNVTTLGGLTVTVGAPEYEFGASTTGSYIPTTSSPVTVTDYTQSGTDVTFSTAPATGSSLTWEDASSNVYGLGAGNGSTTSFNAGVAYSNFSIYKKDWQGNQLQYSTPRTNNIDNTDLSTWSLYGPSGLPVVTTGQSDPSGGFNALKVVFSNVGHQQVYQSQTANIPQSYGVWLKGAVGGEFVGFGGNLGGIQYFTLTNAWAYYITNNTITGEVYVILDNDALASTVYMFAPMNQPTTAVVGDFIPTAGSPVTVTDYSYNAPIVTFATAPANGAPLLDNGPLVYPTTFTHQYSSSTIGLQPYIPITANSHVTLVVPTGYTTQLLASIVDRITMAQALVNYEASPTIANFNAFQFTTLTSLTGKKVSSGAGDITYGTNTITRASGSWITDGFVVGDQVIINSSSVSSNDGLIGTISSVNSATEITLTGVTYTTGTSTGGDNITNCYDANVNYYFSIALNPTVASGGTAPTLTITLMG